MKTTTRKIISFFFILLGFTPLLFTLVTTLKKNEVRKRMKEELEYRELQTITIPEDKVIWMDKHEIWVNESMFDIHTKKIVNGVYTFTGLYDEDETLLMDQEHHATKRNSEQNKLLAQFFKSTAIPGNEQADQFESIPARAVNNVYIPENVIAQFREILTPPPQV